MDRVEGPPENLLAARRALEGLEGFSLLEDWQWYEHAADGSPEGRWVLRCRLSPGVDPAGPIPPLTDWYVLVDPAYPWGSIKFYPAKDGGIAQTFPHQNYNGSGSEDRPWRAGDPCLDTQVRVLGRRAFDEELYGVHERLRWRSERALAWLEAASRDELLLPGEPFELPQALPAGGWGYTVAFQEGSQALGTWDGIVEEAGLVDLFPLEHGGSVLLVDRFLSKDGQTLLAPGWGRAITGRAEKRMRGIWIRMEGAPVLYPWQNPITWGEFREACRAQRREFDKLLREVSSNIRDGYQHPLLIGFPIPKRVGGSPSRMHWYAAMLQALSWGSQTFPGFRAKSELGYQRRDRAEILTDSAKVAWQMTENWHPDDLSARGRLPDDLRSKEVLLVGAGAVGSAVAELLVRGGVKKLLVIDGDLLKIGNLVRHNLGLDDLHENKARALARRLNLASPYADVEAIDVHFPPPEEEDRLKVRRCDTLVDYTGEDSVLRHLELFAWEKEMLFTSVSLGFEAKRSFCFVSWGDSFPLDAYRDSVDPHLKRELELYPGAELPREGAGCWHPLFPARIDDVWPMVAAAIKVLESAVSEPPTEPKLSVFERLEEGGAFASIRRMDQPG